MDRTAGRYDVIVIGGGAAGMMAAGRAAERGKRVLLLERNKRLGEKLRITGGGRCNITNAEPDTHKLLARYGDAEPYLHSAFARFGVKDTFAFFEKLGLPIVVQARNRAFPNTEKAPDVVAALERYMKENDVEIRTGAAVSRIEREGGRITGVVAGDSTLSADSYILATGGVSHPETGSKGDGFEWLSVLGHTIKEPTPTIVPLKVEEKWVSRFAGVSVPDMKITFFVEGKRREAFKGPLLFTHFGISGPTILNAAGKVADWLEEGAVTASVDLFPSDDLGILDKRLVEVFREHSNKGLRNALKEIVPPGSAELILSLVPQIDTEQKVHSLPKEERRALAEAMKAIPLTIKGLMGFERAVVADGGLLIDEVDMRTMRSKKFENLYVTGDLLHINRPSGGYSLQLCWTTGFLAGESV
jgi:predicted Rossmann fold flavoprotein